MPVPKEVIQEFMASLDEYEREFAEALSQGYAQDEFIESEHPRKGSGPGGGQFTKGSGSSAHNVDVASVLSQPHQTGSEALKKTKSLIDASEDPVQKAELITHYAHQVLKKHHSLTAKESSNAAKYAKLFQSLPKSSQEEALKKYGSLWKNKKNDLPSKTDIEHAELKGKNEAEQGKIEQAVAKVTGQQSSTALPATPEEMQEAKGTAPLKAGYNLKAPATAIAEFNAKFSGENTPTTEEGLKKKVAAYKGLKTQENEKAYNEEKEAEKTEEKKRLEKAIGPEAAQHLEILSKLIGGSSAKPYLDYATKMIEEHGIKGITPAEASHIVAYSSNVYAETNAALRAGVMNEERWRHVKELNKALDKLPAYEGETHRGASLSPKQVALYKRGMIVEERGFMSTSKGKGFKANVKFSIKGKTGRNISRLSLHPGEREVLFRSGTRFKVKSNDGHLIELEEVD